MINYNGFPNSLSFGHTLSRIRGSTHHSPNGKGFEISAMRKNQRPFTYVGLGGVENGYMVGVGWVWVLHKHYAQSSKIVDFHVS